jgi:polysaccharide export outer membrane protein
MSPYPDHVLAPPDIVQITGVRLLPREPYILEPLDSLFIRATNTFPDEPINGLFRVETDGRVLLGSSYGAVMVGGLTMEAARTAIENQIKAAIKTSQVFVSLVATRGVQAIAGEHLVQPNGTLDLGTYGSVPVAGLTTAEAKEAIESRLRLFLEKPEVIVSVAAFNSKVYYIITDGGGFGEQLYRFPATGGETVLDALSQIYGLPAVAWREHIWLARPSPPSQPPQVMPIDWKGITRRGETATNYQVLPGDRIYVQAQPLVTVDTYLARAISPIERLFGITLLGNTTVQSFRSNGSSTTGTTVP